ncbi:hypothetical protein [Phenylobacterium sp.]|uniref:hypothetical protein n=1 Tax=Phenylobacterium sp. TaxID=1871053 RepID=UPI0030F48599
MTDELDQRYIRMVEALHRKTVKKELKWGHYSSKEDAYFVPFGSNFVVIGINYGAEGDEDVIITIRNSDQIVVDRFTDVGLSDYTPTIEGFQYYFSLMKDLHRMAARQSSGADGIIDDILNDLGA